MALAHLSSDEGRDEKQQDSGVVANRAKSAHG